jgi:PAS domain S-box-containing protein
MEPTPVARLLIVDDEAAQMKALCNTLEPEGYCTTGFASPRAALAALQNQTFDLVLSDLMMPELDGIAFLHAALKIDPNLVGIVMTGHGTIDTAVQAMQTGAIDYILKPFKLSAILPVITRALAARRLRLENIQLHEAVGLHALSSAIAFASDLDTVLQRTADAALSQSWVSGVSILVPSEDGNELVVAVSRGKDFERIERRCIPLNPAVSEWIERSRELLARPDEEIGTQLSSAPLPGISSDCSIPMLAGGNAVGILSLTSVQPGRPVVGGQMKALNILASAAASALERVTLVDRLRTAEQRYRRLAENAPDVVYHYEIVPQPGFSYVSPVVKAITGYSPEEHYTNPENGLKMVHQDDRPLMETLLRGGFPSGSAVAVRCLHRNGTLIWLEHRAILSRDANDRVIALEGIARDITERRVLEAQLRQSQKMEAIGLLAGGVAHDFNNLLMIINTYSELILSDDKPATAVVDKVEQIRKAGDHAAALTRQLLAFGRKQVFQPRILNVNTIIESTLKILRRVIGEDVELSAKLQPRLGAVRADPDQVEQILMNLVVNARDAMPDGGKLIIETRDDGPDVMLSVTDTGCGMDAETQARVFEPFFTTKEPGKGTGLGLSIVYGAVKQSGGRIRIISARGKGATFQICLPRVDEMTIPPQKAPPSVGALNGSETILVVEDDPGVRLLISAVLQKGGYRLLLATDGKEALQVCRQHEGPIALVLSDIVMPGMSGTRLIEELTDQNPGMRVLYMSGYPNHMALADSRRDSSIPLLQKPFTPTQLLQHVRDALDQRATRDASSSV